VEGVALAAALVVLVVAAWVGEAALGGKSAGAAILFLATALTGTAAGYRAARSAFRLGRRRQGRDPEPSEGAARLLGGFIGFWIQLIVGFAFWALLLQFFKRVY
jgi:hypothetical protein